MKKEIEHDELGIIYIRYHVRARSYHLRILDGKLIATLPVGGNEQKLLRFVDKNLERIKQALDSAPQRPRFNEQTQLQTASFRVHINCLQSSNSFFMGIYKDRLQIVCPAGTDFDDDNVQSHLRQMIIAAMRCDAVHLLPERVKKLAVQHHFNCRSVRITSARRRWGSCNNRGDINLSLFVMLLPWHLIDFIILHELCHTVEMNHSERFHQILDRVTDGKSKALQKEVLRYKPF